MHTVTVKMITRNQDHRGVILASPSLPSFTAVMHPNLLVAYFAPISIHCHVNNTNARRVMWIRAVNMSANCRTENKKQDLLSNHDKSDVHCLGTTAENQAQARGLLCVHFDEVNHLPVASGFGGPLTSRPKPGNLFRRGSRQEVSAFDIMPSEHALNF